MEEHDSTHYDGPKSSGIPNSGAEREPFVQARGHSPPRRSEAEGGFRGSFEMPRHKELEKLEVAIISGDYQVDDMEIRSDTGGGKFLKQS